MHFWTRLLGVGLAAGAAYAALKLVERVQARQAAEAYEAATADEPEPPAAATPEEAAQWYALCDEADTPNTNPVDAPPAQPVTDPLKIADPADFQNWDDLGCQG